MIILAGYVLKLITAVISILSHLLRWLQIVST